MKHAITSREAEDVICSDPVLMRRVSDAIRSTDTPAIHRDTARRCVAHLTASGWLPTLRPFGGDEAGWVSLDELVELEARSAFRNCEKEGLIPSGFLAPLLYWGLRQAVWAVLVWVIRSQLTEEQKP